MLKKKTVLRFILGLKIRQLRTRQELSLKELSERANLSVSYLNEIEKGRKYPKIEKLAALADGLKIDLGELLSFKTGRNLHPLLKFMESDSLESLPLDLFGLSETEIVDLIGADPEKFASFVLTMLQLSRAYDVKREDVYAAALRSYIEAHENYFSELEKIAKKMRSEWSLSTEESFFDELKQILTKNYNYEFDENLLGDDELLFDQKILARRGKNPKLYLHPFLSQEQKTFYLAVELGHIVLGAIPSQEKTEASFFAILQNYKTRYFAGALLIDEKNFTKELKLFFSQPQFNSEMFLQLRQKYRVNAETFFHRLTQMLSAHFKTDDIFYLEVHDEEGEARIKNELHLTQLHGPHGVRLNEHYCERWIAVKTLKYSLKDPIVLAQISIAENGLEYFSLSMAEYSRHQHRRISYTIGFAIKKELYSVIKFLDDLNLKRVPIGQTCERCSKVDCLDRTTPAVLFWNMRLEEEKEVRIRELLS